MSDNFKFGEVHGDVVAGRGNTVAGRDLYKAGHDVRVGDSLGSDPALLEALAQLKDELASLRLTTQERESAAQDLDSIQGSTDRASAAEHLEHFTAIVKGAGEAATAGSKIVDLIATVAKWLGPVAAGVLALL